MKRLSFLVNLLLLSAIGYAQNRDSLTAAVLLHQLDRMHQTIRNISYHVQHTWHDASVKDSVQVWEGDVGLVPDSRDTIFGNRFHIKNTGNFGSIDSYYDGKLYIEANHRDRSLLRVDPCIFPNDFSNPAKSRSVLRLVQSLIFRKDLSEYLLSRYPYGRHPQLSLRRGSGRYMITIAYPPNDYGASTTFTLGVEEKPMRVVEVQQVVLFNGTRQTQTWKVSKIRENRNDHVVPDVSAAVFAGYRVSAPQPRKNEKYTYPLLSKAAPGFRVEPIEGGAAISLIALRGKYVLLDFWETWCGYCIMAFPKIKLLYEKYHRSGLEVIGITTENEDLVSKLITANRLPYLHVKGDTALLKDYLVAARPHYVLVGPDGNVAAGTDLEGIEKILQERMNQ
ncbi:TlpA family protein disulfide reductase [Niabella drilacis]|uniref:Thiol-disulfide isomerase or thioredoxin n=1 Tax=Niabella drilacis (strain DSM 25811 / CCM 8410 / CCUG 62505 / LMG 26954 / E90) TaxID=1285928 RepID=A0A1G6NMD5_NIADE|nr:TlpA disulfide reductase family protein [Niabella drilacis]SDC68554.1 Thiol-disulfide isomerase or thioredoxin [Niabella drilacis]